MSSVLTVEFPSRSHSHDEVQRDGAGWNARRKLLCMVTLGVAAWGVVLAPILMVI